MRSPRSFTLAGGPRVEVDAHALFRFAPQSTGAQNVLRSNVVSRVLVAERSGAILQAQFAGVWQSVTGQAEAHLDDLVGSILNLPLSIGPFSAAERVAQRVQERKVVPLSRSGSAIAGEIERRSTVSASTERPGRLKAGRRPILFIAARQSALTEVPVRSAESIEVPFGRLLRIDRDDTDLYVLVSSHVPRPQEHVFEYVALLNALSYGIDHFMTLTDELGNTELEAPRAPLRAVLMDSVRAYRKLRTQEFPAVLPAVSAFYSRDRRHKDLMEYLLDRFEYWDAQLAEEGRRAIQHIHIHNEGDTIMGDNIKAGANAVVNNRNSDSTIITNSSDTIVSAEDVSRLTNLLDQLRAQEVGPDVQARIDDLAEETRSPSPKRERLAKIWTGIEKVLEAGKATAEIATAITKILGLSG